MASDSDRFSDVQIFLLRSVTQFPADLAAVIALVALTGLALFVPGFTQIPLRILVGFPFVLFVPGYAFIAALFPESAAPTVSETDDGHHRLIPARVRNRGSIDGIERVTLSFGTSIVIVPLLGLLLNFTPWGIRLEPVFITVGGFTLLATAVGVIRRWSLPPETRFRVPYRQWIAAIPTELIASESRTDLALNGLFAVSVLLATASVTYTVAVPEQGEAFTEFYILTKTETGELVADDYPTEFTVDEPKPIHVGIDNHEHHSMDYTVVIKLQRVSLVNNTTHIYVERELQRRQVAIQANRTWHQDVNVTPTITGQRLRLVFLLYRAPPAQPTVKNAYRELHLWVNVTSDGAPPQVAARPVDHESTSEPWRGNSPAVGMWPPLI